MVRTPTWFIPLICFFLLFLMFLLATFVATLSNPKGDSQKENSELTAFFDPHAKSGNLPGRSKKEIQDELNKIVEAGMFNISIASLVNMKETDDEALVRIENIAANHHHMKVSITLDGEKEPIYQSAGLAPGQYIEYARFNRKLLPGTYLATAVFTAYDTENLSPAGEAAAKITIVVHS